MKLNAGHIGTILIVTLITVLFCVDRCQKSHHRSERDDSVIPILPDDETCQFLETDKLFPSETDSCRLMREIDLVESFRKPVIPRYRFFFFTDSVEIERVQVIRDTVFIKTSDSSEVQYSSKFLTQYPNSPKLLQSVLKKNTWELSLLTPQGEIQAERYFINTDAWNYNYIGESGLTAKRKKIFSRIHPYVQATVRPINLLADLDLGLCYNTSRSNYEIGINGYWYNPMPNPFGWDVFLRYRYYFK